MKNYITVSFYTTLKNSIFWGRVLNIQVFFDEIFFEVLFDFELTQSYINIFPQERDVINGNVMLCI